MAEVKGVLLNYWMKYLQKSYSEEELAKKISELDPSSRHLIGQKFLDASWYPYETLGALRKLVRTLSGKPDPAMPVALGRFLARNAYTGVYKSLIATDPLKTVSKFGWTEDLYFKDLRKIETETLGGKSCKIRYRYESGIKPWRGMCASLIGFWSEMLEMSGGSNLKGSHDICIVDGADRCEFVFEWD